MYKEAIKLLSDLLSKYPKTTEIQIISETDIRLIVEGDELSGGKAKTKYFENAEQLLIWLEENY